MLYHIQCYIIINQYCRNDFLFRNLNFLLYSFATKPSSGSTQPSSGAETLVIDGRFLSGNWETTFFRNLGRYNFLGDINVQSLWYVREVGGIEKSLLFCNSRRKVFVLRLKIIQEKLIQLHSQTVDFFCEFWEQQYSLTCDNFQGYWSRGKNWFLAKENVTGNFESFPL